MPGPASVKPPAYAARTTRAWDTTTPPGAARSASDPWPRRSAPSQVVDSARRVPDARSRRARHRPCTSASTRKAARGEELSRLDRLVDWQAGVTIGDAVRPGQARRRDDEESKPRHPHKRAHGGRDADDDQRRDDRIARGEPRDMHEDRQDCAATARDYRHVIDGPTGAAHVPAAGSPTGAAHVPAPTGAAQVPDGSTALRL